MNAQVMKMRENGIKCNLRYSSASAYDKVLMLLLTQNGGITEQKESKLHMPCNTAKMSPVTCARVHSVILHLTHEHNATQWRGGSSDVEDHHQKVHYSYWGEFQEKVQEPSITMLPTLNTFQSVRV